MYRGTVLPHHRHPNESMVPLSTKRNVSRPVCRTLSGSRRRPSRYLGPRTMTISIASAWSRRNAQYLGNGQYLYLSINSTNIMDLVWITLPSYELRRFYSYGLCFELRPRRSPELLKQQLVVKFRRSWSPRIWNVRTLSKWNFAVNYGNYVESNSGKRITTDELWIRMNCLDGTTTTKILVNSLKGSTAKPRSTY